MAEPLRSAVVLLVALTSGAINAVAGGGSLLTFALLFSLGVPPLVANATSTVALLPGTLGSLWGYRDELQAKEPLLPTLLVAGLVGGALGAWLLLETGDAAFARMVPWLVGGATAAFAFQRRIRAFALKDREPRRGAVVALFAFQLLVSTYGGFFGAAMGILMLAAYGVMGVRPIHRMNALKHVAAVATNGVAALYFVVERRVAWQEALLMAIGATLGGWGTAHLARRTAPAVIEGLVVIIGIFLTAVLAWRAI